MSKANILKPFKVFIKKSPVWARYAIFTGAGFVLGLGGLAVANPGNIVGKVKDAVWIEQDTVSTNENNAAENTDNNAQNNSDQEGGATSAGFGDQNSNGTTNSDPTSTPTSTPTPSTPSPTPTPADIALQGIEGLVASVRVGQAIYAPAVTPAGATLSYQWRYRIGVDPVTKDQIYANIPGANSNPYYPTTDFLNKWISVVVTGINGYTGSLPSPTDALVN